MFFLCWKIIKLDLVGEKRNPWCNDQSSILLIASWRSLRVRVVLFDCICILKSSANRIGVMGKGMFVGRSFIASRKRVTLRTDPCGTPLVIV